MNESQQPASFFEEDHRACDALWAAVESAADAGDTPACQAAYARFEAAMHRHLAMEEEVLFPWFEERSGLRQGPTMVMRSEHEQMRAVLTDMRRASEDGDAEGVVDYGDTLLMLIQQHNLKEESILYPMCDRMASGADQAELARKLSRYAEPA